MAIGELIHGPMKHDAVNDLFGKLRPEAFRSASNEVTQKCAHAGGVGIFSKMKVSEKVQGLRLG